MNQKFTEFMSEHEISDLLNEYRETSVDRQLHDSLAPYPHSQQTEQVSSKAIELSMPQNSTPSLSQTQPRSRTKKRATSASAFTVHEDQPGTRSSVKVSTSQQHCRYDFSSFPVCPDIAVTNLAISNGFHIDDPTLILLRNQS